MNYKQLGQSSLTVSTIGFGCMSLGNDQSANDRLLQRALDKGINFFDTADLYGQGQHEETVGKALKNSRQQVIIATKVGNQWRPDGSGWDWNPRKTYILQAVEKSLQRLQTDYIDLYQLHGGTLEDNRDESIEAFELLQQQGKIRHYGISSIRPNVIRAWVGQSAISSVMMQYSLLDRRPELTCLPLLQEKAIGVLARGSVAKGLLVNKPAADYLNHDAAAVSRAAAAIRAVSGDHRSPAQTAIQFVLQHPAITSTVLGIRTMEQLEDAVGAVNAPVLQEAEMELLRNAIAVNQYTEHV